MDHLLGAQMLSKTDLWSGYWQMLVHKEDVPKTVFFESVGDRTSFS